MELHYNNTSKKDAFAGSSNLRKGPLSTENPLLQKVIVWLTTSGGWSADDTVPPESNRAVPVKLFELEDGRRWSAGSSIATCLALLKIVSTSLPLGFVGSWTSIPLQPEVDRLNLAITVVQDATKIFRFSNKNNTDLVNKCLEIALDKPNMNISGQRKRGYNTSLIATESTTLMSAYNKLSHKLQSILNYHQLGPVKLVFLLRLWG